MFVGSVVFTMILVAVLGLEVSAWTLSIFLVPVLVFSLGAAIIEAVSPKNMDNWTVSIGVALMMFVAYTLAPSFWPFPLF